MVQAWSPTAATTAQPAGAESNSLPATSSSRTAHLSRVSLRLSRTKSASLAPRAEFAGAIAETESGAWLVSARDARKRHYAIKLWKPGAARCSPSSPNPRNDLSNRFWSRRVPRRNAIRLALHPWDYANLLALDARVSRDGTLKGAPASVRLETQDAQPAVQSALGTAPVETGWFIFRQGSRRSTHSLALLDAKAYGSAPGARLVLGARRRAAHLRGLPRGTGARVGEPCPRGASAHHDARRPDDASPSGATSSATPRRPLR